MRRIAYGTALAGVLLLLMGFAAMAQVPAPRAQKMPRAVPRGSGTVGSDPHALFDLQRRVQELDRLLSVRSISRAQAQLADLEQHAELAAELLLRRVRLDQLLGEHLKAIATARKGLLTRPHDPALWRYLAESLLAVDKPDSARIAQDHFLTNNSNVRSAGTIIIRQCMSAGRARMAVGLIDSLRVVLSEPAFGSLAKSQALLAMGLHVEAAREISAALRIQPHNLPLVRSRILQGEYDPLTDEDFLVALDHAADEPTAVTAEKLLVANLLLVGGRADAAVARVANLVDSTSAGSLLLQNVSTLNRELELLPHDKQYQATVDYLVEILSRFAASVQQSRLMRRRAADRLAEVCEQAISGGGLGDDPQAAVTRFMGYLDQVRAINPTSERLYSAQISLARYLKEVLKEPETAARKLEHLLLDTELPTAGIALTRLTLGECYLAAGDTARGRAVLTQLGRDPDFHGAAGFAHYHLARLDLAEGGFMTARDRFAVVALDNPGAPYANDALELGLAVAEELDNSSGGPEILGFYAPCVLFDLLDQPSRRLAALRNFVRETSRRVDLSEPQHLLEKGMFELAGALADADSTAAARSMLRSLYTNNPDSRYAPRAMDLAGRLLQQDGQRDAAQDIWTRLLVQYPDYIFLPDVRDELKELP